MTAPAREGPIPPEQYAVTLVREGKPKAEIWQALVDRGVVPSRATEIVTGVTSEDGVECSGCHMIISRSSMTFSDSGEPLCPTCASRSAAEKVQRRANTEIGLHASTRMCQRCLTPSVICSSVRELRWRRGEEMKICKMQCKGCGYGFTGYTGAMPFVIFFVMVLAPVIVAVTAKPLTGGDVAKIVVCPIIGLFFLYKRLVWRLHPEA